MKRGLDARTKFVDSHINKTLAFQIRSLRGDLSQEKAMEKLGMNQNAISRLENPYYGKSTLTTLKRIASAYDVGLLVEFVPFNRLVDRVSGTPHTDYGLSPSTMNLPSFEQEVEQGTLDDHPTRSAIALELGRLCAESAPTITGDLLVPASEQWAEGAGVLNVAAPSASGAIHTPVPTVPTGSYDDTLAGPRRFHFVRAGKSTRSKWLPRNMGRRLINRRRRFA